MFVMFRKCWAGDFSVANLTKADLSRLVFGFSFYVPFFSLGQMLTMIIFKTKLFVYFEFVEFIDRYMATQVNVAFFKACVLSDSSKVWKHDDVKHSFFTSHDLGIVGQSCDVPNSCLMRKTGPCFFFFFNRKDQTMYSYGQISSLNCNSQHIS